MNPYPPAQKAFARELRSHQTDAEQQLWHRLRRKQLHGLQFYRQKPIGPYIVDFYCAAARLVIELDGSQHFEPAHQSRDQHRDAFLAQQGLLVLRFDNLQALKETDAVIQVVSQTLETRIPPAPLLQRGVQTSAVTASITPSVTTSVPPPSVKGSREVRDATPPFAKGSRETRDTTPPFEKGSRETRDTTPPFAKGSRETRDTTPPFAKGGPGGICSGDPYRTEAQDTSPALPPEGQP
ncbi:DUF559 domain-containing protein [Thauera sp. WH-1]|uniref:endonuclease domain-containing protein n=1 Tax=Thauera sp. WH-1 TaxID=3398230 RepID=UPI0039FD26A1